MDRDDAYYQAMLARDYRFDGKFFVGVKTTGVYCRPICPARPLRRNVEFFATRQLAERKGYRPCLRCRPESAPLSPAWWGKSALVQRALKAISEYDARASEGTSIGNNPIGRNRSGKGPGYHREIASAGTPSDRNPGKPAAARGPHSGKPIGPDFAQRFGVSDRHLRRLFEDEIGSTPNRILIDNRLDFARKLIVETGLPVGEIAFAAGFGSVRRFNHAVKERFGRAPSLLRRNGRESAASDWLTLSAAYRPPFDWEASLAYYRSHRIQGLESCEDGTYERVFPSAAGPGILRVTPGAKPFSLDIRIRGGEVRELGGLMRRVRRMFDLDSDPLLIANAFAADARMDRLFRDRPGLRAPRGWDAWETAACSILGQLVSIEQANRMIAKLVAGYGEAAVHPLTGAETHFFPAPQVVAEADLDIGTTGARKQTLREFARRVAEGELSLDSAQDPRAFREALLSIKGIGPWTSEYISLRAIADTDAFPAADLVLKRAVAAHPDPDLERLKPWRGYAAAYLWNAHASQTSHAKKGKP